MLKVERKTVQPQDALNWRKEKFISICAEIHLLGQFLYALNYHDAPLVKEESGDHLVLEGIRNKVWNPVFTTGVIAFVLSMTLRGFFDQHYAAITLGISTIVLFSGVWILSATATIVFDRKQSEVYFVYRHLGYLQKIYVYPLSSFEEVMLKERNIDKGVLYLRKDDGTDVKVAAGEKKLLEITGRHVSAFLNISFTV